MRHVEGEKKHSQPFDLIDPHARVFLQARDFVHRDVDKLHLSLAMTIPPMLVLATGCALAGLGPYESAVAHARPETRPDGRLM